MATPDILRAYEAIQRLTQSLDPNVPSAPPGSPFGYQPNGNGSPQGGVLGGLQHADAAQNQTGQAIGAESSGQPVFPDPNVRTLVRKSNTDPLQEGSNVYSLPTYPISSRPVGSSTVSPNGDSKGQDGFTLPISLQWPIAVFYAARALLGQQMASQKQGQEDEDAEPDWDAIIARLKKQYADEANARDAAGKAALTDPGTPCTRQYDKELEECSERWPEYTHKDYYRACQAQAAERLAHCQNPDGKPQPKKWTPPDEEIGRNYAR